MIVVIKQLNLNKKNHLKSISYILYKKCFRIKHTNKNPDFFDVDIKCKDYFTNHNKKSDSYLVNRDFKLVFNKFTAKVQTVFHHNTTFVNLKTFLLFWIEFFIRRGCKFSQNNGRNFSTIVDKMNMIYEHYVKQPMQPIELKLNMIIAKNPNLKNSLITSNNHPLFVEYFLLPFNI